MSKSKTKNKEVVTEQEKQTEQKQQIKQVTGVVLEKGLKPQKEFKKICYEELFKCIQKLMPKIDIRPEGLLFDYIITVYNMLAISFPERFEDVVMYPVGDTATIVFNTKELSRKNILNPDPDRIIKMERHLHGSWPGYDYSDGKPTKAKSEKLEKSESDK